MGAGFKIDAESGIFRRLSLVWLVSFTTIASSCFNNQRPGTRTSTSSSSLGSWIDPSPSSTASPSPSSAPVLANCREGSNVVLSTSTILTSLSGGTTTTGTIVSLAPVLAGELSIVQLTALSWRVTCPSQFVHWLDDIPSGHFLVPVNYQYRDASNVNFSGTTTVDVTRWALSPTWVQAGPGVYSLTADGKILLTVGGSQYILPTSTIPGSGGTLTAPRFYAVAKASDNIGLYAIGSAPQGSGLYRVHPQTGELWIMELSTFQAPLVTGLSFVSATDLQLSTQNGDFTGPLPSTPRTGQIYETPVDQ